MRAISRREDLLAMIAFSEPPAGQKVFDKPPDVPRQTLKRRHQVRSTGRSRSCTKRASISELTAPRERGRMAPGGARSPSLSRFALVRNQRYRANGTHEWYLITSGVIIGTRHGDPDPLNAVPERPQRAVHIRNQTCPAGIAGDNRSKAALAMMDRQNLAADQPASADPAVA